MFLHSAFSKFCILGSLWDGGIRLAMVSLFDDPNPGVLAQTFNHNFLLLAISAPTLFLMFLLRLLLPSASQRQGRKLGLL